MLVIILVYKYKAILETQNFLVDFASRIFKFKALAHGKAQIY